jgi:hypothetical protein
MPSLTQLLDNLWTDYSRLNPQARRIHDLLRARGETVVNDHIAFRTYDDPRVGLDRLADAFLRHGYEPRGQYTFKEKKLLARHYEHPDPSNPLVFISQLKLAEFSPRFQQIVHTLVEQVPADLPHSEGFPVAGRPWDVSYSDYEALREESEYGAWMAAWGFRANHFTVLINTLTSVKSLQEFNEFLKQNGFQLNASGGEIKGSAEVYLEQSSTLADEAPCNFTDGERKIPCCYYEFARRYPMPDGKLFTGFVEGSADKIFESTDRRS